MGTEISLDVGGMCISWAKNNSGTDHGFLFQPSDRKRFHSLQLNYDSEDLEESLVAEMEIGFTRPLQTVVPRLELLGYTMASARNDYSNMAHAAHEMMSETPADLMSVEEFVEFVTSVSIDGLDDTFVDGLDEAAIHGRFNNEKLKSRLPFYSANDCNAYSERSYFGSLLRFLDPYALLRLLAENPRNLELSLDWQYGPLVANGWADPGEFRPSARRTQTYLIATEGSSDTHILSRAFEYLRPEIADFFRFIDVSDRHPFSGTGSLVKFAEGLAKIDVHNRIVFLLDNDAEGVSAFQKIARLDLPANMRTQTLPALDDFQDFPTIGPEGEQMANINGRAAAIECYLDLKASGLPRPIVRWTNYRDDVARYHGALQQKDVYCRAFFERINRRQQYETWKLTRVLDTIVETCTSLATDILGEGSGFLNSRVNALN